MKNPEIYVNEWFDSLALPDEPSGLYAPIEYTLEAGGKRLRPTLLLASHIALGGQPETVRNQCIGIELFHNFTLLHDDVMDNSPTRRGRPTVHQHWNSNTAILSGDAMLTMACQYMCDCKDSYLRPVIELLNLTAMEIYEGQQLDMDFESRDDVTVEEYMEMIRLKTSVLLGCALKTGALLAGAPAVVLEKMYHFGIDLGLGFQLRDDYLDTFGDENTLGKQVGSDILNDKKTWLMIKATENGTYRDIIKSTLKSSLSDTEKIESVRNCYFKLGLDKAILSLIDEFSNRALETIKGIEMNDSMKEYFTALALKLCVRTR